MGFEVAPLAINSTPYHDILKREKIYLGLKSRQGHAKRFVLLDYWKSSLPVLNFCNTSSQELQRNCRFDSLWLNWGLLMNLIRTVRKVLVNHLPNLFVLLRTRWTADTNYSWTESDDFTGAEKFYKSRNTDWVGISAHHSPKLLKQALYPTVWRQSLILTEGAQALSSWSAKRLKWFEPERREVWLFYWIHDSKSRMDVTVFSDQYRKFASNLSEGNFTTSMARDSISRWSSAGNDCTRFEKKQWRNILDSEIKNHENDKKRFRIS